MKNEKKHIDRLFQEGLKNFEATPSHTVWKNVSEQLLKNKKERKVIPLWMKVSAIAAGLLLLLTLGNSIFFQDKTNDPKINETIVDTESNNEQNLNNPDNALDSNNNINSDYLVKEDSNENSNRDSKNNPKTPNNTVVNNSETIVAQNDRNSASDNNTLDPTIKKELANELTKEVVNSKVATNENSEKVNLDDNLQKNLLKEELSKSTDKNSEVAKVENANEINDKEVNEAGKLSIEDAIAKNDEKTQETKSDKDKITDRWSLAPNVAPVYFNSLGTGSSIDKEFVSNNKSGEINMSYGVSASYALNDKINVRVGVNNVKLGFKTHDAFDARTMLSGPVTKADAISNIVRDEVPPQLAFVTVSGMNFAQVPEPLYNQYNASIDQKLGFIEVPLEMEYEVSDKRLGLRVLGGFSALFLNENEVFSTLNNETTLIGEATNINKTSFSANFGVGLDLNLSEKFRFNIEPTFKYQLNTFKNTSGNFKPYFIGVYSGFSFKF